MKFVGRISITCVLIAIAASAQAVEIDAGQFAPTEYTKTVQGNNLPEGQNLTVRAQLSKMICRMPSIDQVKAKLQELANNGQLGSRLRAIEDGLRTSQEAPTESLKEALHSLDRQLVDLTHVANSQSISATSGYQATRTAWGAGQPLSLAPNGAYRDCLNGSDAAAWHRELVRIIKAYLATPLSAPGGVDPRQIPQRQAR